MKLKWHANMNGRMMEKREVHTKSPRPRPLTGRALRLSSAALYESRSTIRTQCSDAISAYARHVKFNLSIPRVQLFCTRCI